MADVPTTAVSQWLKEARLSQTNPETGNPWSQDYFLARIKAETGWAPSYAPYLKAERGESNPKPETVNRIRAFWAKYEGVPEFPNGSTPPPPLSLEEQALQVARDHVAAIRENTAMLAALLAQLTGQPPVDPRAAAAIQAQADAAPRTSPLPLPDPTGTTGR